MEPPRSYANWYVPEPIQGSPEWEQLTARCDAHKIEWSENTGAGGHHYLQIALPSRREKRPIRIFTVSHAKDFLSIPFERLRFLSGYWAVCSYDEGTIEAETEILWQGASGFFDQDFQESILRTYQRNFWELASEESSGQQAEYFSCSQDSIQISLGPPERIKALRNSSAALWGTGLQDQNKRGITLKIGGLKIEHHDATIEVLERIANSFFFQIDVALDLPLVLKRQPRNLKKQIAAIREKKPFELKFPSFEYDDAPMQLYWYAKKADGMPLLQFLAYYQVIEFYFPVYSEAVALEKIRTILKNPMFRPDSNADMRKILTALQSHLGKGFGGEKTQLSETIQACIDNDVLKEYLMDEERSAHFFSKRKKFKNIPLLDTTADLRKSVADRIYQIRCRIVHSKGESGEIENEPILPFSEEADLLDHDIALVQFIAREVLIKGSKTMKL